MASKILNSLNDSKIMLISIVVVINITIFIAYTFSLTLQNHMHVNNNLNSLNFDEYKFVENKTQWESQCGVIMFYHIGKTGGTNANYVLQQKIKEYNNNNTESFSFEFWSLTQDGYNKTDALFHQLIPFIREQLNSTLKKILFIHQHHRGYSFTEFVEKKYLHLIKHIVQNEIGCEFLYITMLRQPILFALSFLAYNRYPESQFTRALTKNTPNYFFGYLNYQIEWEADRNYAYNIHGDNENKQYNLLATQKISLNESFILKTINLLHHFDIIGFTEKYNEFLLKVYQIANIPYDIDKEFEKTLYKRHKNKLDKSHKIQNISAELLKTIIETRFWDLKLYYSLRGF